MLLGDYSPSIYFKVSSISLAITLILMYWISQYYHHDKPFPKTTISNVANHYPQYVLFRTGTISGSVLTVLGWLTNHIYLSTISQQKNININQYKPVIMLVIGILGSIALMGSTALIDTGHQNMTWHQHCAATFFVLTIIAQLYNTVIYSMLWYKNKFGNVILVYTKIVIAMLFIIQIYLSATDSIIDNEQMNNNGQQLDIGLLYTKKYGNLFEWTIAYTIIVGYFVMSLDFVKFRYVYEQHKQINNSNGSNQMTTNMIQ